MFQVNGLAPFSGIQNQGIPVKGITIQPNQIVFGKVYKLYQNGTAEVQVRDVKVYAQVETELKEGQNYYFIALKGENGKLLLKVLDESQSTKQQHLPTLVELLKALKLPDSSSTREVVQFFLKENLPVIKETIEQVQRALGQEKLTESIKNGIVTLMHRNIPITKETLASITALVQNPSMSNEMEQLLTLLKKEDPDVEQRMMKLIQGFPLNSEGKIPTDNESSNTIKSTILPQIQGEGKSQMMIAASFQQLLNQKNEISPMIPQSLTGQWENLIQEITKVTNNTKHGQTQEDVKQLQNLLGKIVFFIEGLTKEGEKELGNKLLMNFPGLSQSGEKTPLPLENKEQALMMLKNGVKEIGLQHERELFLKLQPQWSEEERTHSLKEVLLEIREKMISPEAKSLAEQLLLKVTGQQLLGKETNSPFLFYTTIFPVFIENTLRDMVIQWGGRKNEKDTIDADYCRVVFLLELANLGETVVDMSVQNRIVSLSIYNNHGELRQLGDTLYDSLEEGLKDIQYMLSSVKYIKGEKGENINTPLDRIRNHFPTYSGVDFKI